MLIACHEYMQKVEELHRQLRGERYTQVRLTLGRKDGSVYNVTVLRHAWHEFDTMKVTV